MTTTMYPYPYIFYQCKFDNFPCLKIVLVLCFQTWFAQVNILQKSGTFAMDRANFCQQNFGENFDKNINFNAKLYWRWHD